MSSLAVALAAASLPASAVVTYTYIGPNFNFTNNPITGIHQYTLLQSVTFTFTSDNPLAASLSAPQGLDSPNFAPLSWSLTDGVNTISSTNGGALTKSSTPSGSLVDAFFLDTNGRGQITGWYVAGNKRFPANAGYMESIFSEGGTRSSNGYASDGSGITSTSPLGSSQNIGLYRGATAGRWVITEAPAPAVPEPGSALLMLLGLGTVCACRRFWPAT